MTQNILILLDVVETAWLIGTQDTHACQGTRHMHAVGTQIRERVHSLTRATYLAVSICESEAWQTVIESEVEAIIQIT